MSEALRQFHFLQPWWLLGLLALPLLAWLGWRSDPLQRALKQVVDPELLPHLVSGHARHTRLPSGLLTLGWTLAVLAMAGPTWSRIAQPMFADRAAQVVAISLSRHMLAADVPPNRMERARYKAHDLLSANRDGMNALIGYAGQSFVVAPLTSDFHSLDSLLDAMSPDVMPVDGDNAAQAIEQGVKLIRDAKLSHGSIVLITDDADTAAQTAGRAAAASGVRVSVLGIGTSQGAPVPQGDGSFLHDDQGNMVIARRKDDDLRALAEAGSGRYVAMTDNGSDIAALHTELQSPHSTHAVRGVSSDAWQDEGPWLLMPLLLVVVMAFRRGWVLFLPWVVLPLLLPTTVKATGWPDWWRRPDQQAAAALKEGHAAEAQRLAQDPAWRGAAAYRAKDYASAVQALQQAKGADAQYNLGNALAQLGRYPQAIKAYDHALQLDPRNNDARTNRKIVEEAMRQQQKSPSSQQQKSGGQSGQQKQNGQNGQSAGQQKNAGQGEPNKSGQGQDSQGQHEDQSGNAKKNGSQNSAAANPQQDQDTQHGLNSSAGQDASKLSPTPASSTDQAQTAKAQQALQSQMDKALAASRKNTDKTPAHELGVEDSDDPLSKLPSDVRRDLQRVPDDPGALLRRKFELEYRERMGAQPVGGDQP